MVQGTWYLKKLLGFEAFGGELLSRFFDVRVGVLLVKLHNFCFVEILLGNPERPRIQAFCSFYREQPADRIELGPRDRLRVPQLGARGIEHGVHVLDQLLDEEVVGLDRLLADQQVTGHPLRVPIQPKLAGRHVVRIQERVGQVTLDDGLVGVAYNRLVSPSTHTACALTLRARLF